MASLNLGSAKLSIEAETRLGKAKAEMQAMSKAMVNVSRRATTMGKSTKTSAVVQQSALARVRERIINLQHAYDLAGQKGHDNFLKIAQAGNVFAQSMSKAGQSQDKFRDSSIRLNRSLGGLKRELTELKKKGDGASGAAGKMTERLRNLGSASVLAVGPLSGFGARVAALGAIVGRTNLKMAIMFGGMAAGVFAVFKLTAAIIRNGMEVERLQARLTVATGAVSKASAEFTFMKKIARELGSPLLESARGYGLLAAAADAAGLKLEDTRKIYKALSMASVALKLEGHEVTGIFRAFQQMLSKGNVQAEELRGQLGERLPGALNLAGQALGVTTQQLSKMLEDGEVLAVDLLPKLADVMINKFAGQGLTGMQTELNKTATEWSIFLDNLDESIGVTAVAAGSLKALNVTLRAYNGEVDHAVESSPDFIEGLTRMMKFLPLVAGAGGFDALAQGMKKVRVEAANLAAQGGMDFPGESFNQNLSKVNKLNDDFIASMKTVGKAIRESVLSPTEEWQEAVWEAGRAVAAGQITLGTYKKQMEALNVTLDENLGLTARSVPIMEVAMQGYDKMGAKLNELGDNAKGFGVDMRLSNDVLVENLERQTGIMETAIQSYGKLGGKLDELGDASKGFGFDMRQSFADVVKLNQDFIAGMKTAGNTIRVSVLTPTEEWQEAIWGAGRALATGQISLDTYLRKLEALNLTLDENLGLQERSVPITEIVMQGYDNMGAKLGELGDAANGFGVDMRQSVVPALEDVNQKYDRFARIASSGLASAIVNADNLSDAFANIAKRIAEAALEMAIFNALSGLYGGGGGGQGAGTSASPNVTSPSPSFGGPTGLQSTPINNTSGLGGDTFVDVGGIDASGSTLTAAEVEEAVRAGVNTAVSQAVVVNRQMSLRNQN